MQRGILIYGWKLDPEDIMECSAMDDNNICIHDYEKKINNIKKELKTEIDFLEVNTDYDSDSINDHPIYIALNYLDLRRIVDKDHGINGEGIIDSVSLNLIKKIDNSKNIICCMDQKDIITVTKKLKIDVHNPNVYIDYYEVERNYFKL